MAEPFWQALDHLVAGSRVIIDRPRGSAHPRFPDFLYPLDYGYLEGTTSGDGGGIDLWRGSLPAPIPTAIIVTVDLEKRDSEIKLLLGCTPAEVAMIVAVHNRGSQAATLLCRPDG